MATPKTLRQFGKELRKLINSPKVFSLLEAGDWGAGGCWTLAEALVEYLGPPARIMVISERCGQEGDVYVPVSHFIVQYGDIYIDYNGAQTELELFRNLEKEDYSCPGLNEFGPELGEFAREHIFCNREAKRELLKHLRKRFG
jgi:hypothetical protein